MIGFLNINKAAGMTAHDLVARVRRVSKLKQVGHAGTLDPMATGVLPIAIGKACRLLRFLEDDKTYLAGILFGAASDTDDVEGKITRVSDCLPSLEDIEKLLPNFLGSIDQVPPNYSAVHIQGERAYRLARRGETEIEIPSRRVQIFSIEVLGYHAGEGLLQKFKQAQAEFSTEEIERMRFTELQLRIHCGTGTYIRSIARDLGALSGSAACLSSLIREQAGSFKLGNSIDLETLLSQTPQSLATLVLPPEKVLSLASMEIAARETARRLLCGQLVDIGAALIAEANTDAEAYVMITHGKKAIAICSQLAAQDESQPSETRTIRRTLKPEVVLADANAF